MAAGVAAGVINGFWVAYVGLPSLAVTLAGLIGYRGYRPHPARGPGRSAAFRPGSGRSASRPAGWGPLTAFPILIFIGLFVVDRRGAASRPALGRLVFVMGNSLAGGALFGRAGANASSWLLFVLPPARSSALAGLLYAARLGSVRGDMASGFELDIITIVLLGGVSIFGGSGNLAGVGLSVLVILNLRNGMGLADITGNTQTSVIGALLILSVLVPNLAQAALTEQC